MPIRLTKIGPALLLFLVCFFAAPAQTQADPITITTTGGFFGNGVSGANSITYGSGGDTLTLTFVGANNSWTNPPVNAAGAIVTSFGQVLVSVTGNGATITPTNLHIAGTHTGSPFGQFSFNFTASIAGTITQDSSNARLLFPRTFTLTSLQGAGNYTHMVFTVDHVNGAFVNLVPPSVNGGLTNVTGTAGPIPEPGTLVLLGTGLVGFAAGARRRLRRRL